VSRNGFFAQRLECRVETGFELLVVIYLWFPSDRRAGKYERAVMSAGWRFGSVSRDGPLPNP
jgi:hypothetical protein